MTHGLTSYEDNVILAVFPCGPGVGYTVFIGLNLYDAGTRDIRKYKNANALTKIEALIDEHQPDVVLIENYKGEGGKRRERVKELLDGICALCANKGFPFVGYSRAQIQQFFINFGAKTKYEIAQEIARWFPELRDRVPEKPNAWKRERLTQSMFDAVSLVLTHYYHQ